MKKSCLTWITSFQLLIESAKDEFMAFNFFLIYADDTQVDFKHYISTVF